MRNTIKPLPRTAPFDIAVVREQVLTDISVVYNVHIIDADGNKRCTLGCVDQSAAYKLADAINVNSCHID